MILVFVETDASGAIEVSREAVTFARTLSAAGNGVPIDAVVVGEPAADLGSVVETLGARRTTCPPRHR
jgi:electron transfer flavoprotein alpha subunit